MNNHATDALIPTLTSAAHKFRLGHETEGSHDFAQCIDLLEPLLPELQNVPTSQSPMTAAELIRDMLAAQERQDWLALADSLEYDLPLLLQTAQ